MDTKKLKKIQTLKGELYEQHSSGIVIFLNYAIFDPVLPELSKEAYYGSAQYPACISHRLSTGFFGDLYHFQVLTEHIFFLLHTVNCIPKC